MKKLLGVVVIVAIAVGGILYWRQQKKAARDRGETSSLVTVTQGSLEESVEATGEVTPLNRVEIRPPVSGRVEQLLVDEGRRVKSGEILAWMSSSDRAAILDAARAKGPEEHKQWEDAYKPTPIVAPLSGVVIARHVVVGQTVEPSTVLFAMSDRLIVLAQVDEADIGRVRLQMPVRIALDAYPDRPVNGHVFQILFEGKNVSNVITYGVKIAPDTVPPFFRSQMTANIVLVLDRRDDVLLLPSPAIRESPDGKSVLVPNPDGGKPVSRPVKTGLQGAGQVEIVEGLNVGDRVLVFQQRYIPQRSPQSSPLMMGGSSRSQNRSRSGESRQR